MGTHTICEFNADNVESVLNVENDGSSIQNVDDVNSVQNEDNASLVIVLDDHVNSKEKGEDNVCSV